MMGNHSLDHILFLDIETVGLSESYAQLSPRMQQLWNKKADKIRKTEDQLPEELYNHAGIYAEFGKIVCISVAHVNDNNLRIKSFIDSEEKTLLQNFATLLNTYYSKSNKYLCAHNGKEFDFPYLCRRMLINGITLPAILDVSGKKPWETSFLDTMEMWKFGDYKHYTSLDLLAAIFHIPSPKDDIDGSMVHDLYWQTKDVQRIAIYCEKDVLTIVQLFLCFKGEEMLSVDQITVV
jgi:DNA polymerase elongation subunit (family B)